jgi:argininosuccinate lyase
MAAKPQPWSGRFKEPLDERVKRFNASVGFDRRLARQDIAGSLAHARMLAAQGILSRRDLTAIERGLARIGREIDEGRFRWSLDAEDVHLNIERRLTALVGEAGKRLHTARSRNDQVATDLRLWLRGEIDEILRSTAALQRALLDQAERHASLVMPGFTHLQVAQPVTFGHHLLAYVEMLERDRERLAQCRARVNRLPLGSAALAGTSFPIDRKRVARELGFDGLCENSLDAVSDRDFAVEFCACASLAMVHLSRLAEELVLWSNPRFGFVRLPEEEPRRARAGARQERARDRQPDGAPRAHEGAAACLQQGQPGGQGAALRRGGHAQGLPGDLCRAGAGARAGA